MSNDKGKRLRVTINLDNDAFNTFGSEHELRQIFEQVIAMCVVGEKQGIMRDTNGNSVGAYGIHNVNHQ